VTGSTGPAGATGIGLQGTQGLQGIQGPTGPQGLLGPTGIGLQGTQGLQGIQGPTGPAGTNGIQGATGPAGTNGVTSIVAGTNITISPTNGLGAVTINSSGGGAKSGTFRVALSGVSVFGSTTDASGFPSSIGTWSTPTTTTLTLTFNASYTEAIQPIFSGYCGFWVPSFSPPSFKLLNLAAPTASTLPTTTIRFINPNWIYTFTINATTLTSSGNNGTYGFFMNFIMAN
jgi:hypothetical protein